MESRRKPTAAAKRTLANVSDHMMRNSKRRRRCTAMSENMFSVAVAWDKREDVWSLDATKENEAYFGRPLMDDCAVDSLEHSKTPWEEMKCKMTELSRKEEMPRLIEMSLVSLFELAAWWLRQYCKVDSELCRESAKLFEEESWDSYNDTLERRRGIVRLINKYASMIALIALMVERGHIDDDEVPEVMEALRSAGLDHARLQGFCQVMNVDVRTRREVYVQDDEPLFQYEFAGEEFPEVDAPSKKQIEHETEFWPWIFSACRNMNNKVAYCEEEFVQILTLIKRICFEIDGAISSMISIMEWKFKTDL